MDDLESLDSIAFKIGVVTDDRETYANHENVFQILLQSGNQQIIDFFYSIDSDCSVKPMLIQNQFQIYSRNTNCMKDSNRFELTNAIPFLDVSFFHNLL